MLQPPRNRFTLIFTDQPSVVFTPINWKELEVVLSRDYFAVDQEVTTEVRCTGVAADDITHAYGLGNSVTLRVETLSNDWTYDASYWEFQADFQTYTIDGSVVSIGFIENSIKDMVEKNKGTKYDLPVPSTFTMEYSGVTLDRSNQITAMEYKLPLESLSASNRIIAGVKSQTERSDSWIFSDHQGFYARALKSNPASITFTLGDIKVLFDGGVPDGNIRLYLLHGRFTGTSIAQVTMLMSWSHVSRVPSASFTFQDYAEYTFVNNGSVWTLNGITIPLPSGVSSAAIAEGDFICLYAGAKGLKRAWQVCEGVKPVMKIVSSEVSQFTDHPVKVMPMETVLASLLNKMTGITPKLTYKLPKYRDNYYWIPVLTSGSALQNAPNAMISVSFDDVMQFLRCAYGATYDISGTTVTIDYLSAFYDSGHKAMDVVPINGVKIKADTEHVFNRVEVGWDTDDDIDNGQFEPLCKNVFSISSDVQDKTLDLVSPFKGSPYTVEQYMREKALESSKTRQQDNDVFVFCVEPFVGTNTTVLYRDHEPASTLFNIPLTPMRFLIANGRYIGVSLYRRSKVLSFVSTDRTASGTYSVGDGAPISESDGANTELVSALSLALFRPEAIELSTCVKTPNKAAIDAMRHKYFTSIDEKNGITYDFYLNDVSLPLTVGKEQEWRGLIK
jgi:hypothetical protein